MRSRTSFFSGTVFKKDLRRFWPLWVAYLVILLLAVTVAMANDLSRADEGYELGCVYSTLSMNSQLALILTAVVACLSAMAVFSYLYNSRSANMMASLPLNRTPMFLTRYLAGLSWLVGANVIAYGAAMIVCAGYGVHWFGISAVLGQLAINVMLILFFYGFACFCAVLTGNLLTLPLVYAVLNVTAVAAEELVRSVLGAFVYGLSGFGSLRFEFLSPIFKLWNYGANMTPLDTLETVSRSQAAELPEGTVRILFEGWTAYALYAAAGIVLVVLALLIYRRRHMETAGDVVAVKPLRPVFRYCMTFGCALAIGMSFYALIFYDSVAVNNAVGSIICMVAGAFIGYFASEMLMQKSFRVFRGKWRGFAVSAAIIIVLMGACELDLFGYEKYVPDSADVKSVNIEVYDRVGLDESENIENVTLLHRGIIEHKADYENAWNDREAFMSLHENGYALNSVQIDYVLKNDRTVSRLYQIYVSEAELDTPGTDAYLLDSIVNSNEAIFDRKKTSVPVTENTVTYAAVSGVTTADGAYNEYQLSPEEAVKLYNCIMRDMDEGTIGRIWLYSGDEYDRTVCEANINIELVQRESGKKTREDSFWTTPTRNARWTNEYLKSLGIEFLTYSEISHYEKKGLQPGKEVYVDDLSDYAG